MPRALAPRARLRCSREDWSRAVGTCTLAACGVDSPQQYGQSAVCRWSHSPCGRLTVGEAARRHLPGNSPTAESKGSDIGSFVHLISGDQASFKPREDRKENAGSFLPGGAHVLPDRDQARVTGHTAPCTCRRGVSPGSADGSQRIRGCWARNRWSRRQTWRNAPDRSANSSPRRGKKCGGR